MGRVLLNLATTLDGYISRKDGSVDFLDNMDEVGEKIKENFETFLKMIDVIIMGRTTYDEYHQEGFEAFKDKKIIVLSNSRKTSQNTEYYHGDLKDLINRYDGNIWCFGGSKMIHSFMEQNLIDEFHITIIPVLIGDGKKLFDKGSYELNLHLENVIIDNEVMTTIYRKREILN